MSGWLKISESADDVARDGAEAVQAAMAPPGQVASLILPADTAWNRTEASARPLPKVEVAAVDAAGVEAAAQALHSGKSTVLLMNGILTESRLALANRIAQKPVRVSSVIPLYRGCGAVPASLKSSGYRILASKRQRCCRALNI